MSRKKNRGPDDAPQIPPSQVRPKSNDSADPNCAAPAKQQPNLEAFAETGAGVAAKE